jgi:hypothetical protein
MVEHGELRLITGEAVSKPMHMRCVGPVTGRVIRGAGGVATVSGFAVLSDVHKAEAKTAILDACGKPLNQTAAQQKELARKSSSRSSPDEDEDWEESTSPSRPMKRLRAAPASTAAPTVAEGVVGQQLVEQMANDHSAMLKLLREGKVSEELVKQSMDFSSQILKKL